MARRSREIRGIIHDIMRRNGGKNVADEKVRFQMRISQETDQKVAAAMKLTNSQSKNEFVENALIFY